MINSRDAASNSVKAWTRTKHWLTSMPRRLSNRLLGFRGQFVPKPAAVGPTASERREDLVKFYGKYEELVEVLIEANSYGPTPKLSNSYDALRRWMQSNYQTVHKYAIAYLALEPEDARQSLGNYGLACDAFESLFTAPTLDEFLRNDDGRIISRIMRTRRALTLYGEHLRQLAACETTCV